MNNTVSYQLRKIWYRDKKPERMDESILNKTTELDLYINLGQLR